MKALARIVVLAAFALSSGSAMADPASAEISAMLHSMFDKPGSGLNVNPVVAAGDHAIAGWTQGDMGGRALLRRQQNKWAIVLCAGDEMKNSASMIKAGVSAADALLLEQDLERAEANLDPAQRAMFSRFEGIMMMDATSNHRH